jgi:hypothetical protein
MTVSGLIEALALEVLAAGDGERVADRAFVGDILSHALGRAPGGAVWITVQVHLNVVAVAVVRGFPAIILAEGRRPEEEMVERAKTEGIALLTSPLTGYELAGRCWELGLR